MNASKLSNEEAIHIYLLATAYLYNARIGSGALGHDLYAKEMWEGIFNVWDKALLSAQGPSVVPVATCTYMTEANIWMVELRNGEKIGLFDNGGDWEVAKDDDGLPLVYLVKKARNKRQRRGRT